MKVEVQPGWHIVTPDKKYFPGDTLELDAAEAKRLETVGIVKRAGTAEGADPADKAKTLNVADTVALVQTIATLEELDKLAEGETRKGVLDGIAKRRAELDKPAE